MNKNANSCCFCGEGWWGGGSVILPWLHGSWSSLLHGNMCGFQESQRWYGSFSTTLFLVFLTRVSDSGVILSYWLNFIQCRNIWYNVTFFIISQMVTHLTSPPGSCVFVSALRGQSHLWKALLLVITEPHGWGWAENRHKQTDGQLWPVNW